MDKIIDFFINGAWYIKIIFAIGVIEFFLFPFRIIWFTINIYDKRLKIKMKELGISIDTEKEESNSGFLKKFDSLNKSHKIN